MPVGHTLEQIKPISAQCRVARECFLEQCSTLGRGPPNHFRIIPSPGTTPSRPTPDVAKNREIVGLSCGSRRQCLKKVIAAHAHDPSIILVFHQQAVTVIKKCWLWQAIIFKNHAIFFMLEKPIKRTSDGSPTPEIFIAKQGMDLTGPVHLIDDGSSLPAKLSLLSTTSPSAISGHIQPWRPSRPDPAEHLCSGVWAIEYQKQNRTDHTSLTKYCGSNRLFSESLDGEPQTVPTLIFHAPD